MKSKVAIIDGHNFLFRGFYGVPAQVKRPDGTAINAVYGFFSLLRVIIKKIDPEYLIIVFDSETSANKKKLEKPEYKANRPAQDNDIFSQLFFIKKCLDIMGICWVEDDENEADDIIGTYSAKFNKKGTEVFLCSNDHDFFQLVHEKTFVLRGFRGEFILYDHSSVVNKFGLKPEQYTDYLSLIGDPTDNVKGINGLGKKRASDLLLKYHDIKSIYQSFDLLSPTLKKMLNGQENMILARKKFLEINSNLSLPKPFNTKKFLFSKEKIPERMGEFLNVHWEKII